MSSRSLDTHISLSSLESLLLYFFFVFYYIFLSVIYTLSLHSFFFFFFNDPPTPEISPLSLHDALPIFGGGADFQSRGSSLVFELQCTRRRGHGLEVLERDLHALIAAEEDVIGFEIRFAGERSPAKIGRAHV